MERPDATLTDIASFLGMASVQTVKNWETRGPSAAGIVNAASRGVSARWIESGTPPMLSEPHRPTLREIDLENNPDYCVIKHVSFVLSAGISGFAVDIKEEPSTPIAFRRDWCASRGLRPEKLFAVRVLNGSMQPGLFDGDLVVVNTAATEPKDGHVFAVNYDGEMLIKRLVRDDGQWWLRSDNPDQARYPRKLCGEGAFLIGEVVQKQSERI